VSVWIKICGLTSIDAVHAAIECKVDAVGFVFALSKRQIRPSHAAELARAVPAHIAKVAVMLHPSQQEVDEILRSFRPDVLQTDASDFESLSLPRELHQLPVVRVADVSISAPRVLFEGAVSGQGKLANWDTAASMAKRMQLVLAGGLTPMNVAQAIAAVRPFGVDVSSGVENAPGCKDPEKIREFVHQARSQVSQVRADR
jgi:phosphoribosylanthranilate isomerase